MFELKQDEMHKIEDMCEGLDDIDVWSCIQGHMGRAWVDNVSEPAYAKIVIADFCYLLGCAGERNEAEKIILQIADECKGKILVIKDKEMEEAVREICENRFEKITRYLLTFDRDNFDIGKLSANIEAISVEYQIKRIDNTLYHKVLEKDWTLDLCSNFASENDFMENGIGYVVLQDNEIVSGASSYAYSDEGIEITIGTQEEHKRKGLALACASKLIIDCLDQNKYPRWEAANMASVSLAEKLGYSLNKEYTAYII